MSNLHLYFGEEKLLINDEIRTTKSKIVPDHLEVVNYIVLDGQEVSEAEMVNAMSTVPMMARQKLVVIREARFFSSGGRDKSNEVSSDFLEFLQQPPEHTLAVFTCDKPDKRKKLYKLFQKTGVVRDFSKPSPKIKAQWIQNRAKLYGKNMDLSAAYYIGEYTENLFQADNELKKIVSFTMDHPKIRRREVEPIFSKSLEANIFKLTDYIGGKKAANAVDIFEELMVRGEKGIVILYMISKHLMDLASVKSMADKPVEEIRSTLELHPFVLKKALQQSRNFAPEELAEALRLCQKTDLDIKRGRVAEKIGIELLIIRISS